MNTVLVVYIVFIGAGAVFEILRAFLSWRAKTNNANKIALLLLGRSVVYILPAFLRPDWQPENLVSKTLSAGTLLWSGPRQLRK